MSGEERLARKQGGSGIRVLLSLACVVIVVAGLKAASELFIPVMLGLLLAMMSLPILNWLDRRGLPRPLAVLMTILVDFMILGGIVLLGSGVIGDFQEKTPKYVERMVEQATEFSENIDRKIARLEGYWQELRVVGAENEGNGESPVTPEQKAEPGAVQDSAGENGFEIAPVITFGELVRLYFDPDRILAVFSQIDLVSRFTSVASKTFFALIVMIFVLAESGRYAHKFQDVLKARGPDLTRFQSIARDIQKYLAIKTAVSALTGILAMIACYVFRIDFPLLWGLVAFLFNYVPAIGSIVAGIPPVLLALILHGFWPAMGVTACYLAINITIGNFLEPMLLGDRFGISTVIVILSVLFWGFIWGPVGMLLAVPLTMLVKVMLDNSSDFRWISALMGKGTGDSEAGEEEAAPAAN
ncbi:MAG: AI-2E family transporter [Verrucomicrobiales bacterium]|nr:AI-2E family transporter [bacterium]MDF2377086.1 AI-2E family transporter [Verrucomicrobiales bacterium]